MRILYTILVASLLVLIASEAFANVVQVGKCLPRTQSYSTISQAVSSVPAGSTVLVCPGTYPEQVTIAQSLTLRGVQSGNAANPTITVPVGGLTQNVTLRNGVQMFFQLLVQANPDDAVNISGIAVDGSNNQVSNGWLSGICYRSTSGSVSNSAIFNQKGNGAGFGIFLEAGSSTAMSTVSITNNSIHDFDAGGIKSNANSTPPLLTVHIRHNSVTISNSPTLYTSAAAIDIDGVGDISANGLFGPSMGIGIPVLSNLTISKNTIEGFGIGIWPIGDSNIISFNMISTITGAGIVLSGNSNRVANNRLFNMDGGSAFGFNCTGTSNTVIHNTINDFVYGVVNDPGGNVVLPNSFVNVTTILAPKC